MKKTKVMLLGKSDAMAISVSKIVLKSGALEVVDEFCYLHCTSACP